MGIMPPQAMDPVALNYLRQCKERLDTIDESTARLAVAAETLRLEDLPLPNGDTVSVNPAFVVRVAELNDEQCRVHMLVGGSEKIQLPAAIVTAFLRGSA